MMNTLLLVKATKEMVKQFSNIQNKKEYDKKCIEMIGKTFDLWNNESNFLLKLSDWNAYFYEGKNVDFVIILENDKIRCRCTHSKPVYRYASFQTVYEFNQNENISYIFRQLNDIDEYYE